MIFRQWQEVLEGMKTHTRRPVKEGEELVAGSELFGDRVLTGGGFCKWQVGKIYAVQPGRGKKAIGRICITEIRRERVQEISRGDCLAEGVEKVLGVWDGPFYRSLIVVHRYPRDAFAELWNSIHKKPGTRWEDDPEVWVLTFETVKK